MQSSKGRQVGKIGIFIVVGLILAGLLGGGIYFSKQQGKLANNTNHIQVANETPQSSQNQSTSQNDTGSSTAGMANHQPPATDQTQVNTGETEQVPHTGPSAIATTGPEDTVFLMIAVALLSASCVAYVRSNRLLKMSALNKF